MGNNLTKNQEIIRCLNGNLLGEALIRLSEYDFETICKLFIEFCQPIVDKSKHLLVVDIDHHLIEGFEYKFIDNYNLIVTIEIILDELVVNIDFDDKSYGMIRRDGKLIIRPNRPLNIKLRDRNDGKGLYHCSNSSNAKNELTSLLKQI